MRRSLLLLPLGLLMTACGSSTSPTSTVTAVSVTCSASAVQMGQTAACTATAHFSNGSATPQASGVSWQSSNPAVAPVGAASGIVTGVAIGSNVIITATFQGASGTTVLSVVVPLSATLKAGCPDQGDTVCLANLETDLFYTTSASANASYNLTFGDGQTCGPTLASCNGQVLQHLLTPNIQWFPHTFGAGTFTVTLTITDGGAQTTATTTVAVQSLSGTWVAGSGTNGCAGQRTLQLTQSGTSLSGTYTSPSGSGSALNGAVGPSSLTIDASVRDVGISVPGPGLSFFGQYFGFGDGVSSDGTALLLQITAGDTTCGQPVLTFKRQ
jgi:hypothetical protein